MKKSDCTPEQWDRYKVSQREYYRQNRAAILERTGENNRTEAARARRLAYDRKPEVIARRKARGEAEGFQKARWEKIKADPVKRREKLDATRKHRTGMTPEAFAELLGLQDGKCGICTRPFGDKPPRADHCHDSKQPRGLLCHHCNIIEGMVRSLGLTPHEFANRLHHYLSHPPFNRVSSQESQR